MWPFKKKVKYKSLINLTDADGIEIFKLFYTSEDGKFTHFDLDNDVENDSICGVINSGTTKIPLHNPMIIKWLYKHDFEIVFLLHENIRNFDELQSQYDKLYQDFLNELSI